MNLTSVPADNKDTTTEKINIQEMAWNHTLFDDAQKQTVLTSNNFVLLEPALVKYQLRTHHVYSFSRNKVLKQHPHVCFFVSAPETSRTHHSCLPVAQMSNSGVASLTGKCGITSGQLLLSAARGFTATSLYAELASLRLTLCQVFANAENTFVFLFQNCCYNNFLKTTELKYC